MQNLPNLKTTMRMTGLLLAAALVLTPGALAAGPLGLDLSASARVDASAATDALVQAKAAADDARAKVDAQADELRGDAQARAEAALEQTQVEAQAGVSAGAGFGERAMAKLQDALAAVKGFASGLFARASVDAQVG